jgi:hypothetical protein
MTSKLLQTLLFAGAGVIALLFLKLMFDMSRSMSEMTAYVGAMSQDVREMQNSMRTKNDSMLRMEKSVHPANEPSRNDAAGATPRRPRCPLSWLSPSQEQMVNPDGPYLGRTSPYPDAPGARVARFRERQVTRPT